MDSSHKITDNNCKFISFNCKNFKTSIEDVRKLCRSATLVCLQETWLLSHDLPLLGTVSPDFEYVGKSSVDSGELLVGRPYGGVAILWRKGIFDGTSVVYCNSDRLLAIKATIGGRSILVVCVYMPVKTRENLPIFTDILSEISSIEEGNSDVQNVIILGDLNAQPGQLFYTELNSFCADRSWVCADVEFLGIDSDTFTFFDSHHRRGSWLDHCVVSQAAWQSTVSVGIIEDIFVSDHLPIFIECNLGIISPITASQNTSRSNVIWGERDEAQVTKYRDLCGKGLRDIDFPTEFEACSFGHCTISDHKLVLDKMYKTFVNVLCDAAVQSKNIVTLNRHKKRVCGWNEHVREAHEEARLKYQDWMVLGRPSTGPAYDQMCESRKIFKGRLKWCQKHRDQLRMDVIAKQRAEKDFTKFWKSTSKLDIKPGLPANVDGRSDPEDIANLFMEHFKVRSPLGPSTIMSDGEPTVAGEEPLFKCTAKQLKKVISGMHRGKSPGHDGLSIEHFKHAGVHAPRVMSMFFNMCISHSYLPDDLMKTTVVPIVKNKTGDIADKGNYRPISLATTVAKLLDSVLESCLDKYINIHDAQFGFRPGLSTESAILALKHTVQYYTERKTPVYACFLDLSKAFDLVSYEVLWRKMEDSGIPAEVLKIFQYWYANQTNCVRWSNCLSETYGLECGVRQGGLSSPKLFNLYVNGLIVELSDMRVGCRVGGVCVNNISYADDMVLLGPTARSIREMLKVCEKYAASHGLIYNSGKTEFMVFRAAGKCPDTIPSISLNGINIKQVNKFKYLGHILVSDLKDDEDVERERRAVAVRGNMLARRFSRCTDQVKITLFKAYCQGLYTGSLWFSCSRGALAALRVQYNNVFRMMLKLPRFCSASGMFARSRTDGFQAIVRKKVASLVRRIRGSSNSILKVVAEDPGAPVLRHLMRLHCPHEVPRKYMTH